MSEELTETVPATVSFTQDSSRFEIEFADGRREIPPTVAGYLGRETLETLAPELVNLTFAEFLTGFNRKVQKDNLSKFQQNFISDHFGRIF